LAKLKRVEQWTKGKQPFPALVSAFLVVSADEIFAMLGCLAHDNEYSNLFSIQDIRRWSQLYRDLTSRESLEGTQSIAELLDKTPSFLPFWESLLGNMRDINDLNQTSIIDGLRNGPLNDFDFVPDNTSRKKSLTSFSQLLEIPFAVFSLKIFIPSVILYQSTPHMLLRRAIAGDIEALARLVSLDKNLLRVPEIEAVWEPISRNPSHYRFKKVTRALHSAPLNSIKATRVKTVLALAIECLFERFEENLSRPQIRDLFDCFARDTLGAEIDIDLPQTENAFDAAIRLEKRRWKKALQDPTLTSTS